MFFSELPGLFGRDFALGYFLPSAAFSLANYYLLPSAGILPEEIFKLAGSENPWLGATLSIVIVWVLGVLIMVANRPLIRLKEGYILLLRDWNPMLRLQRWRYRRIRDQRHELEKQVRILRKNDMEVPAALRARSIRVALMLAQEFPDDERWVLPTKFGNAIRAFEVYPRVIYGISAITGWERLLTVIPESYRKLVDTAKVSVDFWVNVWMLSLLFGVECAWAYWRSQDSVYAKILMFSAALAWLCSRLSRQAVTQWGEYVKSAFDVFLPDLQEKLNLPVNAGSVDRETWERFSRATIYRMPDDSLFHPRESKNAQRSSQRSDFSFRLRRIKRSRLFQRP